MKRPLLAALVLAAAASRASPRPRGADPSSTPQSFALWVTDKSSPDEAPCSGRLSLVSRRFSVGGETRMYASSDGRYSATVTVSRAGRVTVALEVSGAGGVGKASIALAEDADAKTLRGGFGLDGVTAFDHHARETRSIGNVTMLPVFALS